MDNRDFGKLLIEVRKAQGLTQVEVAEKCNLTTRTIQRIESGAVEPRASTIKILSEHLGVDFLEMSKEYSKSDHYSAMWYLQDLFNLQTHTMRKISIISISVLLIALLGANIFEGNAQKSTLSTKHSETIKNADIIPSESTLSPDKETSKNLPIPQKLKTKLNKNSQDPITFFTKNFDEFKIEGNIVMVIKNNQMGLYNVNGEVIIPCEYDKFEIEDHYVIVLKSGRMGLMNLSGETIIPCEYDKFEVKDNYVIVLKSGRMGLMNLAGETIIPCEYDKYEIEGQYVFVLKRGKRGLMNLRGETLVPCEYDKIRIKGSNVIAQRNGKTVSIPLL